MFIFFRVSNNTISFKLTLGAFIVLFTLITLLIYNSFYAIFVVRHQVAESNKNLVSLYMRQIDNNLEEVDEYLIGLVASNTDLQVMESANDKGGYSFAKICLSRKMAEDIQMYKSIDSFFIYTLKWQDLLLVYNENVSFNERQSMSEYIKGLLNTSSAVNNIFVKKWYIKRLGQEFYLFHVLKSGDTYTGAWVNIKKLLIPLNLIDTGEKGASLFATDRGEPMFNNKLIRDNHIELNRGLRHYYLSGNRHKYLVVGEKSEKGNFNLIALIPDEKILQKLPYLRWVAALIAMGSILLLPVFLLFLRTTVLVPLKRITAVMKRIEDGDLEARIDRYPAAEEFEIVNGTFNRMMAQIKQLRISAYEDQIDKQKNELRNLQLRVNPHFFMNTLNIIYNLARVKNYELIQEMTLCLVQYFRYMFRSNLTFVPLKDELQHIRNYLRIQELRFPESLTYEIEIPESLLDTLVPSLVIQNFVENTFKHAITLDEPIHLSIRAELADAAEPQIKITIRDTGKGFPEKVLNDFHLGNRIIDSQGEHTGIWNVQQRLRLLYGNHAYVMLSNSNPSGAVVEIALPRQTKVNQQ
jgi:two-component system sensor histidine kinase YesM